MSQHTPGPWKYIEGEPYPSFVLVRLPDGQSIPIVVIATDLTIDDTIRRRDNARLIAASPELLEALKAAMEHEKHEDGKCGCCWTLKAEAAIAKAEGKESKDE